MTRAEKRRAERSKAKLSATYTMNQEAINKLKEDAVQEGIQTAFLLMLGLPVSIIQDKFGKLMKKEGREQRFTELLIDRYEMFQEGYFTLDDIIKDLKDTAGVTIPGLTYDPDGGSTYVKVKYTKEVPVSGE